MDAASPGWIRIAIETGCPMRVGRKLRRTLYLHDPSTDDPDVDVCVGIVDSAQLAATIVAAWNAYMQETR